MKTLLLTSLLLSSCSLPQEQKQQVRLTVYWKTEDKWTNAGKTSTGNPLVSYKTVAVDPKVFPYGSIIKIPALGLKTVAHDTGSAVVSKKAAKKMGKNVPVVDLYIRDKKEALDFIKKAPYFVDVIVEPQNEAQ
jgi:3D (Asp-Asp-Asp) domain-containing protein